ncbi:MAG: HD-GYP domain-containing protein [Firmicutes bacterium]|nr:HD-GYP domain-containing protein [Bacillota bacterium]
MRKVPVWALEPGMKVGRPIFDSSGFLLLNTGKKIKQEYICHLRKLDIPSIYIIDDIIPDVDIEDVILDETRQKANNLVRSILTDLEKQPEKSVPKLLFTYSDIRDVLDDIIDQLLDNKNLIINLSDIRTSDNYTFAHSVNVAVMAVTTAISFGFPRSKLQEVGLGSLLHDLGKVKIPNSILNKKRELTPEEFLEIKKHPFYGYDMFKKQYLGSVPSALIILQHHERINGDGYPQGLVGEQIHVYSKICSIADVYDALVSDRPYREAFPPHKALELLQSEVELFDSNVLQKFIQHIAAYPIGTFVELSNGEIGIVVHNTMGFPLRPTVRILCSKENFEPLEQYEINLMEKIDIVIEEVYTERMLPQKILNLLTA